jgi:dTDP-glucose pyrophosphorylase
MQADGIHTVILAAGGGGAGGGQLFGRSLPDAMVPVNGKPALALILDDLLGKGFLSVVVVHRAGDHSLERFVRRAYLPRMAVHLVALEKSSSILESLAAGLRPGPEQGAVQVVLGDTLIRDPFDRDADFVYAGLVEDPKRWCVVRADANGNASGYVEKADPNSVVPQAALAGFYRLADVRLARKALDEALAAGEGELSAVLRRYGAQRPIRVHRAEDWFDFGHIDKLVEARRGLLQPRHFNRLTVDPTLNTLRKVSHWTEKLQDEIDWYLGLPAELRVLTPRLVRYEIAEDRVQIEQEYYGYPTLAELFVYAELDAETWRSVLRHVLRIHDAFCRYRGDLSAADVELMYVQKTADRLAQLSGDAAWSRLLSLDSVEWNGKLIVGWPRLRESTWALARQCARDARPAIVHGDLCFSNVLFDLNARIARLIDPRGRFGRKGIYGDPRYDLAKLRHSVCGLYDFIVADMFDLKEVGHVFHSEVYVSPETGRIGETFDALLRETGRDLSAIKLIEGLLFLSMLPLHAGQPARQRMMFLTGLAVLNEVCR